MTMAIVESRAPGFPESSRNRTRLLVRLGINAPGAGKSGPLTSIGESPCGQSPDTAAISQTGLPSGRNPNADAEDGGRVVIEPTATG